MIYSMKAASGLIKILIKMLVCILKLSFKVKPYSIYRVQQIIFKNDITKTTEAST